CRMCPALYFRLPVPFYTSPRVILAVTVSALAVVTVHLQVTGLHVVFLATEQTTRHYAVLNGTAPNPWQYRLLAELVTDAFAWLPVLLGVQNALVLSFIAVRVLQNMLVLFLTYTYFRKLSVPFATAIIGINLLALALLQADLESDLSFNTYFDVIFYL